MTKDNLIQKKLHEKIRDYFINLGKKHRLILPFAVIGLAITMLVSNVLLFCKKSLKRFAVVAFILCFFLIGNSFAFAKLYNNGFISEDNNQDVVAATDSNIILSNNNVKNESELSDAIIEEELLGETMIEDDLIYLDDILVSYDDSYLYKGEQEPEENRFDSSDWRLILINKQHPIPDNYEFTLGYLSGNMRCDERIIKDLLLMMNDAKNEGISLIVGSPYRDLSRQEMLFDKKIKGYMKNGYSYMEAYKLASQAVTVPGSSEHQVGLAIDFLSDNYKVLDEGFKDTEAGKWLKANASAYGFILRYPDNKEDITSIEFEPWHYRYVGREAARIIMGEGLCLEEFWEKYL